MRIPFLVWEVSVINIKNNINPKSLEQNLLARRLPESDNYFITDNRTKVDSMKPKHIRKDLAKSEKGREILAYMQLENYTVQLLYGHEHPEGWSGSYDPITDVAEVFCDETKTIKETALTVIHEVTHRQNRNKGLSAFWDEYECFKAETLHKKGKLTPEDNQRIIKDIKEMYNLEPD